MTPPDDVKPEITGERDLLYSQWHRDLGKGYPTEEINFVEYRADRGIVALVSVTGRMNDRRHLTHSKKFIWNRTALEREILRTISQAIGVPAYYVLHTTDLSLFHVYTLPDIETFQEMNQEKYADFIRGL